MENLLIYQKFYDLLIYLYIALRQFPKSEKHTLSADIKCSAYRILSKIVEANKSKNKLTLLYQIDVELQVMKTKLRLAHDLNFLPNKKYEICSQKIVEIGKMLGGWIKSQKGL